MLFHLGNGTWNGTSVLDKATLAFMHQQHYTMDPGILSMMSGSVQLNAIYHEACSFDVKVCTVVRWNTKTIVKSFLCVWDFSRGL